MKLLLTKGWTGEQELVLDNPTEQEISELVNSLDWQDFNSVQLQHDSKNFLDVSGNLKPDGLSILFEEHGTQYVSDEAPSSISQLEEALVLFLKADNRFKNLGFSTESDTSKPTSNKQADYDLWKIQYQSKQKVYTRKRRLAVVASIALITLLTAFFYFYLTDELRFIGNETDFEIATVTETKWKPVRGGFIQQITYEFEYQSSKYEGHFRGTQRTGKHNVGDKVKVKFSINNPSNSKRVATYKRMN